MKVGIVWNHGSALGECSFRFEDYLAGLEALGYRGVVICSRASDRGLDVPRVAVADFEELHSPSFWRSLGLDAALVVTWHKMSALLRAIGAAGTRVVSISDSDGQVGVAAYPAATLRRLWSQARTPRNRVRAVRFWFREWRRSALGRSDLDREMVESTRASDVVVQGHVRSREEFCRFLRRRDAPELQSKVRAVPFAIAAPFLNADLAHDRSCRVAVVGRWNDPQKDAPMVAEVLRRFLHHEPRCEAVVIGEHDPCLAELCEAHPRASHRGLIPYHALAAELARCRVLFSASRFEGCPHSALEAMAVGNTLVGPPIPCFESWARQEDFGTVAKRRTAKSLLTALSAEMGRWQRGDRDAGAIASVWRQRLAPAEICRQMLRVDGVPGEGAGHEAKAR